MNQITHTQLTTHHILPPSLLVIAPTLLYLTHGLYQDALAATRVTLYLYSRLDTTSGSSIGCSSVSSSAKGLRRYSYPANSHSLSYLFISASTQYRLNRQPRGREARPKKVACPRYSMYLGPLMLGRYIL